jgi:hypothetical protein
VGPFELEFTDGEETVLFSVVPTELTTDLPVWGFRAESSWSYVMRAGDVSLSGVLDVAALPDTMGIAVEASGVPFSRVVQLVAPIDCAGGGFVTVLDARGRVRWFVDAGGVDVDMVQFTDAQTFVLEMDGVALVEFDPTGREIFRKDDFALPIHHDVFRRDDLVYTLMSDARTASDGKVYVEEILVAVDRAGNETWRWDQHDWLDPTLADGLPDAFWNDTFPDAVDAWHTNGFYVTEEHDVLLSLLTDDVILRVSGLDGSIEWVLDGGTAGGAGTPTFTLVSTGGDASFDGQHHPNLLANGHLTLFDNVRSRAVELVLDEGARTATFAGEWVVGLSCPYQSSLFPVGDGWVATCAERHVFVEYDPQRVETGRMALTCANGEALPRTTRGQPIDLWGGVSVANVTATRLD